MHIFFKWAIAAGATVVAVGACAFIAGASLPAKIEVTRSIEINRPPENVWWVLTDYENLHLWHPQYRGCRLVSKLGQKPVLWNAMYTDGRLVDIIVEEERFPARYTERIADEKLPFSGVWKLDLERRDFTTKVTAHSIAELHRPLDRLFVHLLSRPDQEIDHILAGLKRRVESTTQTPPKTS